MTTKSTKKYLILVLALLTSVMSLGLVQNSIAAETGEQVFQKKCVACHTIGGGKLVGPDLTGVTLRRDEDWLFRQIQQPDTLIAEKDPIALQLLQEYNMPMVPLGLEDSEVAAVISYLKSIEQETTVAAGLPSQYIPTVIVSIVFLIGLTLIGLRVGRKKVDVR
ncbi:MAG TPA: cytochrome c [Gammaproteobacteria bacterium]|nr:cytochrome c [Gammaproteobacteria bacterium]